MAENWAEGVNTRAYGMDSGYVDNLETVEFKSGKPRAYLKNAISKKTHSFMLTLCDVGENSEYKQFLKWFENTVKSGSISFLFPNLITHEGLTEYRFTEAPSATGQRYKEVSISVVEV